MDKDTFELAYRRALDDEGTSYDPYSITAAWKNYQKEPSAFDWLFPKSQYSG